MLCGPGDVLPRCRMAHVSVGESSMLPAALPAPPPQVDEAWRLCREAQAAGAPLTADTYNAVLATVGVKNTSFEECWLLLIVSQAGYYVVGVTLLHTMGIIGLIPPPIIHHMLPKSTTPPPTHGGRHRVNTTTDNTSHVT